MTHGWPARMMRSALLLCGLWGCACAADDESPTRPYHDGPLTDDDFRGKPDATSSYWAWTQTEFRYRYNYRYQTSGGETVVSLTEIEIWGVVHRDKSWNRRKGNPLLLDHEQGHFDITQIYALEAQASLQKRIDKGPKLQARATTKEAAVKLLQERLEAARQPFITDSLAAQRLYDKETVNGTDAAAQAEARRAQKQRLEELLRAEELASP